MTRLQTTSAAPPPNSSALCDQPWSTDPTRRCIARTEQDSDRCLAHHWNRSELLAEQAGEGTIDLTDAEVDADLGKELRMILRSCGPTTLHAIRATFLDVDFGRATFAGRSDFTEATFCGSANFGGTLFDGAAIFENAHFRCAPSFGRAHFKSVARFEGTWFHHGTPFSGARFFDICNFRKACLGDAEFADARFEGPAHFEEARFLQAKFENAEFLSRAYFRETRFKGKATFKSVEFGDGSRFEEARFCDSASFEETTFRVVASFDKATFALPLEFKRTVLAPRMFLSLTTAATKDIDGITRMQREPEPISFDAVRLAGPTELEVTDAHLRFNNVGLVEHLTIKGTPGSGSFLDKLCDSTLSKPMTIGEGVSLQNTSFLGSTGLELVRVADAQWQTAKGLGQRRRNILADESGIDPKGKDKQRYVAVEGLYRQFRSGLESSKAAPAAADFYYGELEMRRLAAGPKSFEGVLLWCYKRIGGYGVRPGPPFLAWIALILISGGALWAGGVTIADKSETAITFVLRNSGDLFGAPAGGLTGLWAIFMLVERVVAIALVSLGVFALRSRVQR